MRRATSLILVLLASLALAGPAEDTPKAREASLGTFFAMRGNEAQLAQMISSRTSETATNLFEGAYALGTASTIFAITAGVSVGLALLLFFLEGR